MGTRFPLTSEVSKSPLWLGVTAACFYGTVAVAANFINKYALMLLPAPIALLFVQLVATLVIVYSLKASGVVPLAPVTRSRFLLHLPVSVTYFVHALLVLLSLSVVNIPMYNTLKRVAPVMVLFGKALMDRKAPQPQVVGAVALIVGGCIVAGAGDLTFTWAAYGLVLMCAAAQAAYMLLAERLAAAPGAPWSGFGLGAASRYCSACCCRCGDGGLCGFGADSSSNAGGLMDRRTLSVLHFHREREAGAAASLQAIITSAAAGHKPLGTDACEQLLYMALLGVPLLAAALLATHASAFVARGAAAAAAAGATGAASSPSGLLASLASLSEALGPVKFWSMALLTPTIEFLLTGSLLLCTHVNSALTTSVVGVLKSGVAVVLGFFLLGGVQVRLVNVLGIALNFAGGMWYALIKYRASLESDKR